MTTAGMASAGPGPNNPTGYPLVVDFQGPYQIARWRPLVHWLLAIPQLVVLYVLGAVAGILWIVAFFTVLFTRRIPEGVSNFMVMTFRYQWRVVSYLLWMRESYPPFTFDMTCEDPGGDPATLTMTPPGELNRWLPLVKWLLIIPQAFVLFFVGIALYAVWFVSFFVVIITGAWPEGMRRFAIGVVRWSLRVNMYTYLLTDVYPPFALD